MHLVGTFRKSCGPPGGHEQGGTGTAAVDWAWKHPGKTASCGPLGGHEPGGTGTAAVDWVWEPPVEAVEKFETRLGEVLSRWRQVDEWITCSIQEVYISQGGFGSTDT